MHKLLYSRHYKKFLVPPTFLDIIQCFGNDRQSFSDFGNGIDRQSFSGLGNVNTYYEIRENWKLYISFNCSSKIFRLPKSLHAFTERSAIEKKFILFEQNHKALKEYAYFNLYSILFE